jgi:adenylosuccinate synthase
MVAPADIIVEFVLMVMSDVTEMLLEADKVMLPPTVSLVLTTRLPVYPVVTSDRIVAVATVIVH